MQPQPILNGDQNRDGAHDVLMGDVYNAEAQLAESGFPSMGFRIATFTDAPAGTPEFDQAFGEFSIPAEGGTNDLQLMGRLMAMARPFNYLGQSYTSVRSGLPTAVQYSTDGGASWKWVSDLLKPAAA